MKLKEDPKPIARCAIAFLKSYPCCICKNEDQKTHRCIDRYINRGSCPVYKILKAEFEKIGRDEE